MRQWAADFHPQLFAGDSFSESFSPCVFCLSSQCLPEPGQLLPALSSLMNWILWPQIVGGVEIQEVSWTGE